jgi:hypothetical protein
MKGAPWWLLVPAIGVLSWFAAGWWWNGWMYHGMPGTPHWLASAWPLADGEAAYDQRFEQMWLVCATALAVPAVVVFIKRRRQAARLP